LAENLEFSHGSFELGYHELLVVFHDVSATGSSRGKLDLVLTDHSLPEASRPWVLRDPEVGLETHFSGKRRKHFSRLRSITGEEFTLEQNFEEDLSIEGSNGGVKGCSRDGDVDNILHSQ